MFLLFGSRLIINMLNYLCCLESIFSRCPYPQIPSTPVIKTYASLAERDKLYLKFEAAEAKNEQGAIKPGVFTPWDWKDYFPRNFLCTKKTAGRPMGPDPAAFKGFL